MRLKHTELLLLGVCTYFILAFALVLTFSVGAKLT